MKTVPLFLALLFLSCNSNKSDNSSGEVSEAIESVLGKTADEYTGKLDELLTLEIASDGIGYPPAEAEKDYANVLKDPKTHSIKYMWKKGRKAVIDNPVIGKREFETEDIAELSWLRQSTQEQFKNRNRTVSPEEAAKLKAKISEKLKEQAADKNFSEQQIEIGEGIAGSAMKGLKFTEVSGVGDMAFWDHKNKALNVLSNGLSFTIKTDTGNEEKDKESSKKIAKRIITENL